MKIKTKGLVYSAIIAAIYAAVTLTLYITSFGVVQFRFAEALTVLPFFSSYAVPGLFLGCIITNIVSPMGTPDLIFGSLATLIAAIITYYIGKSSIKYKEYLAPLPPVISNALIVGMMLHYTISWPSLASILQVGLGEVVCCYGLGLPLLLFINKKDNIKKYFI